MAAKKKKAKASKKAVKRAKKSPAKKAPAKKAKSPASKGKKATRKAAVRKPVKKVKAKKASPRKKQVGGEGDYEASRTFLKEQAGFVKENKAKIPELGRQARAALEGSEGPGLLAAEAEAKSHSKSETEEG